MPIVTQSKLIATDTGITFADSLTNAKRIQHNTVDFLAFIPSGTGTGILTYYQTNGTKKLSYVVSTPNCVDVYYDRFSDKYFSLGYTGIISSGNTVTTTGVTSEVTATGVTYNPNDDFSTPTGTYLFDAERWIESEGSSFIKDDNVQQLVYYTTQGDGILTGKTHLSGTLNVNLDYFQTTMGGAYSTFYGIDFFDVQTNSMEYGVGITNSGGDKYYCTRFYNINNFTNGAEISNITPSYYNLPVGTTNYTITYTGTSAPYPRSGGTWAIDQMWSLELPTYTGTILVPIAAASGSGGIEQIPTATGAGTGPGTGLNTGFTVMISSIGSAVLNDFFQLTSEHVIDTRATVTGTINVQRVGSNYSSSNSALFSKTVGDGGLVYPRIFGRNSTAIELRSDNFIVTSGYTERDLEVRRTETNIDTYVSTTTYPTFRLDRLNANGTVNLRLFYNLYFPNELRYVTTHTNDNEVVTTSGFVGDSGVELSHTTTTTTITTESGVNYSSFSTTSGDSISLCLAPSNRAYFVLGTNVYDMTLPSITVTGIVNPLTSGYDGHVNSGTAYTGQPYFYNSTSGGFLQTTTTDILGQVSLKTVDATLPASGSLRTTYLDMSYYKTWLHNPDNNSILYILPSTKRLYQFNIDPDISAFSAVNTSDYNLRAGTSDQATVTTEVINCWGDPLYGKNVNMEIIAGDGVINPPSDITNISGAASGIYTAGATVGAVQIQVTISD